MESSQTFDGIRAIYPLDPETDFQGTDEEVSARLYVSTSDVQALKDYCNAPENADSTVYLFRYQTSDFISQEATCFEWSGSHWVQGDSDAYFFQETVNLDFDIIDVTFSNGEKDTVIPVVMTPIDVVPEATPPVYTESDAIPPAWWAYVILVVGEALILWLLQILLHKLCGLPNWVMIILVAVTVVLDIFFIQTWALSITEWLNPYLGWLG